MSATIKSVLFGGPGGGNRAADVGLLILRVGIGCYLAFGHGFGKLFHDGQFGPPAKFVESTAKLGFPAPTLFAWCSTLTESIVALLLAIGLFTRPAAAMLAFNMAVAAFMAHAGAPWFMRGPEPSREPAMLYLLPFVMFVFTGAGRFSIDAMIRSEPSPSLS